MNFFNLKITTRLVGAFVLVALIGAAIGLYAIRNMSVLNDADTRLYEQETIGLSLVKEANVERYSAVVALRDAILATSAAERQSALKRLQEGRARSVDLIERASALVSDATRRQAFERVRSLWVADQNATEGIIRLLQNAPLQQEGPLLVYLRNSVVQPSIQVGGAMSELTALFEAHALEVSDSNTVLYEGSRNVMLVLVALGLLTGILLGVVISRQVTRPLGNALKSAYYMSHGDMTPPLLATGTDEVAQLINEQENMRQNLEQIVASVRQGSQAVSTASQQIAQGNQDLSLRTLASRSAGAAREIKDLINESVARVDQGTAQVDDAGKTMSEIVQGIRRVADIMVEISAASQEQSAGVEQIGLAVGQMDQATQQNAALVEEMAAAANSLMAQAHDLVNAVAVFKLSGEGYVAASTGHRPLQLSA